MEENLEELSYQQYFEKIKEKEMLNAKEKCFKKNLGQDIFEDIYPEYNIDKYKAIFYFSEMMINFVSDLKYFKDEFSTYELIEHLKGAEYYFFVDYEPKKRKFYYYVYWHDGIIVHREKTEKQIEQIKIDNENCKILNEDLLNNKII